MPEKVINEAKPPVVPVKGPPPMITSSTTRYNSFDPNLDAKIISFGDDEHSMLKSVSWAMNNHNNSNLLNARVNLSPFAYNGFDNNSNMIPTNGGISQMIGSQNAKYVSFNQ